MEFLVVVWIIFGIISSIVASNKGNSGCSGFILGVLFGPLGLIIVLVVPSNPKEVEKKQLSRGEMKKCPYCAELIKREAQVCRYCGKSQTRDKLLCEEGDED